MERQRPKMHAPAKTKRPSYEINVEEPEPIDNILHSSTVDNVENALHEAFNDILISTEPPVEVNENISNSKSDNIKLCKTENFVEQCSVDNTTSSSILPMSIPCSIGSLPTPCAPELDDLCSSSVSEVPFESLTPFTDDQLAEYYQNKLLFGLSEYIEQFNLSELKSFKNCEHPLNILLQDYLHARLKLESNKQEIKELKYSYITHEKHIWTLEPATYTQYGECQDGNPVSATKKYDVSRFNQVALDNLVESLKQLRILINNYYCALYDCQMIKEKIDYYLHVLCQPFSAISSDTPIGLSLNADVFSIKGNNLQSSIYDLKSSISILFLYQRKTISDKVFISETRKLLVKTIGVLLRVATWKDHFFVLNHILRCPTGVGKWASSFIQIPLIDFNYQENNFHLDFIITTLAIILTPVYAREKFLEQICKNDSDTNESIWVVVDSEGEEESSGTYQQTLRESDIIALLNQIPFSTLFKKIIFSEKKESLCVNLWNEQNLLRLIAIGTILVKLFKLGLQTYCSKSTEYKQFSKRLGHLLQDTANYVTDVLDEFKIHKFVSARIQTEYDSFLKRIVSCLYDNDDRTTWQYLVMLPFSQVSSPMVLHLFQHMLHIKSVSNEYSLKELSECVINTSDDECYYLLTAICNMALSRYINDIDFIKTVTICLFKIGFVSETTKEQCQKTCRTLLSNLSDKHPFLISEILSILKYNFDDVGSSAIYLFKTLPLPNWKITMDDLSYLEHLLLNHSITSTENSLSRYILSKLFSGCNENDINDFMLTKEMHGYIAIIIVKAVIQHAPITVDETSAQYLVHSIKQLVQIKSNEQAFRVWSWKVLYSLKLHLMDLPDIIVRGSLQDLNHYLHSVISIDTNNIDIKCLHHNDPIALYTAIHVTTVGHCVPVILNKGLDYCYRLVQYRHYTATIACLNVIVPFFFENSDCLLESKKFINIVAGIMADNRNNTTKRAMSLLTIQGPSEIILQFTNMIQYQISNYVRYGITSPHLVMDLWTKAVCAVWREEESECFVYVLNTVFKNVFRSELLQWARELLISLITQFSDVKENITAIGSIFNFMFQSPEKRPLLLPKYPMILYHCPYYALLALEAEEWCIQGRNNIWKNLLIKLHLQQGKANVDDALKRVCSELKLPYFTSGHLAIYRWMQYGLEISPGHPMTPLYWQNFFRLYLQRVPGTQQLGCVGRKFFEGLVNSSYLNKINNKLKECIDFHRTKLQTEPNSEIDLRLGRFYEACTLWLTDVRLLESTLFIPSLDSMYEPTDLTHIINGSHEWLSDIINHKLIEENKFECIQNWCDLFGKHVHNSGNINRKPLEKDPTSRIVNRLKSYDDPLQSPDFVLRLSDIQLVTADILYHQNHLLNIVELNIKQIVEFINQVYRMQTVCHENLDSRYIDGVKMIYVQINSTTRVQAVCDYKTKKGNANSINCAGAAEITFQIHESKLNTDVVELNSNNRSELDTLINEILEKPLPSSLTSACTTLNLIIQLILKELNELNKIGDIALVTDIRSSGVRLFYALMSEYVVFKTCPPIDKFVLAILQTIGNVFIMNNEKECLHIENTALNHPELADVLIPLFSPSTASIHTFIQSYKNIINNCNAIHEPIALKLLSKFDISVYLSTKQPLLHDRSILIDYCIEALILVKQQTRSDYTWSLHELFSQHLCKIMEHDFPEHYGEILLKLLDHSKEGRIYCQVWFNILNTILAQAVPTTQTNTARTILLPELSSDQLRDVVRRYATDQRSLSSQQLQETLHLLTTHFANERLKSATGELYSKYNVYIGPLVGLYGMVSHALVVGTLQSYRGMLANKICEFLCPTLISMFGPWLEPWYEGWNTDHRSLKLPWLATDSSISALMVNAFVECITFVLDTMPACDNVLSYVCQWYIKMFAHIQTNDYIFETIHSNLEKLPWQRFIPTPVDLDLIMKVMDQFLPQSQFFLANIVLEVPWPYVPNLDSRILLSLFIKLSNQPNMRKGGKIRPLLLEAQKFAWHQIDGETYENILSWFVSKYDPMTVLQLSNEDWCGTDSAVLDLLKTAAGYNNVEHSMPYAELSLYKRRIFIRAMVRMFISLASRYR
ncbi:ectopic P granules protein 5 homolog isoform X2 [Sipha flava]|nr:ectopic P granules protein 5 homolog isoform X2 [Sipha flava]